MVLYLVGPSQNSRNKLLPFSAGDEEGHMIHQLPTVRLAILSHRFQRNDGQGRVNFEVASAALQSGYHLTIVATTCSDELSSHPLCRFVKIGNQRLPTELLRNLVYAWRSARWLRAH